MSNPLWIASAIAAAVALPATASAEPVEQPPKSDKCYGIVKAGKNGRQTARSSCAVTSKVGNQKDAWIYLPVVDFFEVHPENFMLDVAELHRVEAVRSRYPLSLHAVGLSLGSANGVAAIHLDRLLRLVEQLDPLGGVAASAAWGRGALARPFDRVAPVPKLKPNGLRRLMRPSP